MLAEWHSCSKNSKHATHLHPCSRIFHQNTHTTISPAATEYWNHKKLRREPDTSATRHFSTKTLRHQDTSAPTLSRITGGAVSCRNCPGSKVSRLFVDQMPKCLEPRFLAQKCFEMVLKYTLRIQSKSAVVVVHYSSGAEF